MYSGPETLRRNIRKSLWEFSWLPARPMSRALCFFLKKKKSLLIAKSVSRSVSVSSFYSLHSIFHPLAWKTFWKFQSNYVMLQIKTFQCPSHYPQNDVQTPNIVYKILHNLVLSSSLFSPLPFSTCSLCFGSTEVYAVPSVFYKHLLLPKLFLLPCILLRLSCLHLVIPYIFNVLF